MIINPNLYTSGYYFAKECIVYQNDNYKRIGDSVYVDIEEDKSQLMFTEVKRERAGFVEGDKITITAFIENVGDVPINFRMTGFHNTLSLFTLNPGESRALKNSFVANDATKNQFRFEAFQKGRMGVRCVGIKWELGEATPYIPNENTLETAKRQYFIGGGTSRKYILSHRNIEQSSFGKEVAA